MRRADVVEQHDLWSASNSGATWRHMFRSHPNPWANTMAGPSGRPDSTTLLRATTFTGEIYDPVPGGRAAPFSRRPRRTSRQYEDGVCWRTCWVESCAWSFTSPAAERASSLTVPAASVAVCLTDSTALLRRLLQVVLHLGQRLPGLLAGGLHRRLGLVLDLVRQLALLLRGGSSEETSQPSPKATTPAASGLPWACRRARSPVAGRVADREAACCTPEAAPLHAVPARSTRRRTPCRRWTRSRPKSCP
jgi:hypothetical protein